MEELNKYREPAFLSIAVYVDEYKKSPINVTTSHQKPEQF